MTPTELKQLRDSKGLKQQACADLVGCSLRTWQRWENKKGYKTSWGEIKFGPSVNGIKQIQAHICAESGDNTGT